MYVYANAKLVALKNPLIFTAAGTLSSTSFFSNLDALVMSSSSSLVVIPRITATLSGT